MLTSSVLKDQIQQEVTSCIKMVYDTYTTFGFDNIAVKLSTRPEQRVGSDEIWDRSEEALKLSPEAMGIAYEIPEGEGAFYGPKIEFTPRLSRSRVAVWYCSAWTSITARLGATYVRCENNERLCQ